MSQWPLEFEHLFDLLRPPVPLSYSNENLSREVHITEDFCSSVLALPSARFVIFPKGRGVVMKVDHGYVLRIVGYPTDRRIKPT